MTTDNNRSPPTLVGVTSFDDSQIPKFSDDNVLTIFSLRAWRDIAGALTWIANELQAIRADVKSTKTDVTEVRSVTALTKSVVDQMKVVIDNTNQKIDTDYTQIAQLIGQILTPVTSTLELVAERLAVLETAEGPNLDVLQGIRSDLNALHRSVDALKASVDADHHVLDLVVGQFTPVSGRILIDGKEPTHVTIPVHPTDTISFGVQYRNSAHQAVAGTVPTAWTAKDADGNDFAGVTLSVAAFPDDENGTGTFTVDDGTFVLHAQLEGAGFEAVSDEIDVSPDNTPTEGVVQVTVSPVA